MALYRRISIDFWLDPKVDDGFTPEDKYFYLYLLTNPHTSIAGCYEIGRRQMERETGYNWDTVSRLLDRMERVHGVIRYSPETSEILLVNWWKYNWNPSPKLLSSVKAALGKIKNESFRAYIQSRLSGSPAPERDPENAPEAASPRHSWDTVSIPQGYSMDMITISSSNSSSNSNSISNSISNSVSGEKAKTAGRFSPPSCDEVDDYCQKSGIAIDAAAFCDYYASCGWRVGTKGVMKDWKAAVRNWARRDTEMQARRRGGSAPASDAKHEALPSEEEASRMREALERIKRE